MSVLLSHFKAMTLDLVRLPAYTVPTVLFPTMFYLFFGLAQVNDPEIANALMGSFTAFAVIGVMIFDFGVNVAIDREQPWETFLRTLPVSTLTRFGARILTALLFATASAIGVIVTATLLTPVHLDAVQWMAFIVTVLWGSVPFGLMGIAIGYGVSSKAAMPVAYMLYLPLSYAGGLWIPPGSLPDVVAGLSPFLPTRQYGQTIWSAMGLHSSTSVVFPWLGLLLYTLVFVALAVWGYRRDEGRRYR